MYAIYLGQILQAELELFSLILQNLHMPVFSEQCIFLLESWPAALTKWLIYSISRITFSRFIEENQMYGKYNVHNIQYDGYVYVPMSNVIYDIMYDRLILFLISFHKCSRSYVRNRIDKSNIYGRSIYI